MIHTIVSNASSTRNMVHSLRTVSDRFADQLSDDAIRNVGGFHTVTLNADSVNDHDTSLYIGWNTRRVYIDFDSVPQEMTERILAIVRARGTAVSTLVLRNARYVQPARIREHVSRGGSGYTTLAITGCRELTDAVLEQVHSSCPALTSLTINGSSRLTDVGVCEFVRNHGSHLLKLFLIQCPKLTDASVACIGEHCRFIQRLSLTDCRGVSGASVAAAVSSMPFIRALHIDGLDSVTDDCIRDITNHTRNLDEITFSSCRMVTDRSLGYIALRCRDIKLINASHCPYISNTGVRVLVTLGVPHLMSLGLRGCTQVSDSAVRHFVRCVPSLRTLDVGECPLVTCDTFNSDEWRKARVGVCAVSLGADVSQFDIVSLEAQCVFRSQMKG